MNDNEYSLSISYNENIKLNFVKNSKIDLFNQYWRAGY